MENKSKIFMGLTILAFISCQFGNASRINNKSGSNSEYEYPQDETQDDYEENEDDASETGKTQSSVTTTEKPFETQDYVEKVKQGSTVELKCRWDIKADSVVMWYNDSLIIHQGDSFTGSKDERLSFSKKDMSMKIRNVSVFDEGTYRCRIYPDYHQTFIKLEVEGRPVGISIGHNIKTQDDVSGDDLVFKAGEMNLKFKCNVLKARPEAEIEWMHNGKPISVSQEKDHDLKIEDKNVLIIKKIHSRHAGLYECSASNAYGSLNASFSINVEYKPFFMHHRYYFNAEEGNDVELQCLYKSFPAQKSITWLKNGRKIQSNEKYEINNDKKDHHERTTLLIRKVDKEDLISYQCEVENELGVTKENITVGVGPAPAKFEGYKYINNIVYTDWIIKSHQELVTLQILYRNDKDGWRPGMATITNRNRVKEGSNEWKVQGSIELSPGEWVIMPRSKNTDGWSDELFSEEFLIKIPKDSVESQNMTGSSSVIKPMCLLIVIMVFKNFASSM